MSFKSTCDCYCKVEVPINRQREEIRSSRDRGKHGSKPSSSKAKVLGKISRLETKTREEPLDSKESTVSSASSLILSPETTNALESAERIVRDAKMRIAEISLPFNRRRVRRNASVYLDEPPLDDEEDQVLYIRELVASKFHESNTDVDGSLETTKNANHTTNRKADYFDAPKFQTSMKRYAEYLKYGKPGTPESSSTVETREPKDCPKNASEVASSVKVTEHPNETRSVSRNPADVDRMQRIETFSIQVGPTVNIDRALVAQNLRDLHISPDPSFVRESTNVGTYEFQHNSGQASASRKEKFVRIREATRKKEDERTVDARDGSESKKGSSRNFENVEGVVERSQEGETEVEKRRVSQDFSNGLSKDEDVAEREETSGAPDAEKLGNDDSNTGKSGADEVDGKMDNLEVENVLEKKENEHSGVMKNDETNDVVSVEIAEEVQESFEPEEFDLKGIDVPVEIQSSSGKSHDFSLMTAEEKEKRRKEEHYKMVGQRFSDILQKYSLKKTVTLTLGSSEGTEHLEEVNLYRPSMDKLDSILMSYKNMMDEVIRSTKTIDRFLSHPRYAEYRTSVKETSTDTSTSVDLIPLRQNKIEVAEKVPLHGFTKHNIDFRRKTRVFENPSVVKNRNRQLDREVTRRKTWERDSLLVPEIANVRDEKKFDVSTVLGNVAIRRTPELFRTCKISKTSKVGLKKMKLNNSVEKGDEDYRMEKLGNGRSIRPMERISGSSANGSSIIAGSFPLTLPLVDVKDGRNVNSEVSRNVLNTVDHRNEVSNFDATTLTKEYFASEKKDLKKVEPDYATLYGTLQSGNLEKVFSKLLDSTKTDDFVHPVENEGSTLKKSGFADMPVKNFLEYLQQLAINSQAQNFEVSVKKKMSTNFEDRNSNVKVLDKEANITMDDKLKSDEELIGKSSQIEYNLKNVISETMNKENRSLHQENDMRVSKNANDIDTDDESLKEISTLKSDENNIVDTSQQIDEEKYVSKIEDTDVRNSTALTQSMDNGNKRATFDKSEENKTVTFGAIENGNGEGNIPSRHSSSESSRKTLSKGSQKNVTNSSSETLKKTLSIQRNEGTESEDVKELQPIFTTDVEKLATPDQSVVRETEGNSFERVSTSGEEKSEKVVEESEHTQKNVSDLSKDSTSSRGLSMKENELHLKKVDVSPGEVNNIENIVELKNVQDDDAKKPVWDEMRKLRDVVLSTIRRDSRTESSASGRRSNKTETSSEASHSEGELYMPSSCSYSLGEVRMVNRNDAIVGNSIVRDNNATIFVTKNMLTSWNESTNSLVESVGEI